MPEKNCNISSNLIKKACENFTFVNIIIFSNLLTI